MRNTITPTTGDLVMYYGDASGWATVVDVEAPAHPGSHGTATVSDWSDGVDGTTLPVRDLVVIRSRGGLPYADAVGVPDAVRSDTYAVDYGRVCGPEWMARWSGMYADDAAAAEMIRVAAFFVDPCNVIHTDLFARVTPSNAQLSRDADAIVRRVSPDTAA